MQDAVQVGTQGAGASHVRDIVAKPKVGTVMESVAGQVIPYCVEVLESKKAELQQHSQDLMRANNARDVFSILSSLVGEDTPPPPWNSTSIRTEQNPDGASQGASAREDSDMNLSVKQGYDYDIDFTETDPNVPAPIPPPCNPEHYAYVDDEAAYERNKAEFFNQLAQLARKHPSEWVAFKDGVVTYSSRNPFDCFRCGMRNAFVSLPSDPKRPHAVAYCKQTAARGFSFRSV